MQCSIRISPLRHRACGLSWNTAKETLDEIASPETTKRKRKQPTESKRDSR
jgi:hypothetical protein